MWLQSVQRQNMLPQDMIVADDNDGDSAAMTTTSFDGARTILTIKTNGDYIILLLFGMSFLVKYVSLRPPPLSFSLVPRIRMCDGLELQGLH